MELTDQIRTASEIGATAACLRANRRLRAAIDSTLDADPPLRVRHRLEALREQADHDAGTFQAHLRGFIAELVPAGEEPPPTSAIST
jgi:hypothetical protein